jgi:hypothetical protein
MTAPVKFEVHGLRELEKALTQLPKELVSNNGGVVKTALMAATLPVMRTAQTTVPDRDEIPNTGLLADMIRRRRATKVAKGREAVQVYIRGNKKQEKDAYYAPWLEFGAKGLPGTRWFTKSLESNAQNSINIFKTRLAGSIARIAKKIGNENIRAVAAQVKRS